jgi:hypothetical protein
MVGSAAFAEYFAAFSSRFCITSSINRASPQIVNPGSIFHVAVG